MISSYFSSRSLCDLLRRPSSARDELTAASCLDAHLPLYTFPVSPAETAVKLKRTDSFPTVPDAFEQRSDSPPSVLDGLSPFSLGAHGTGMGSFNSLPLAIPAGGHHLAWGTDEDSIAVSNDAEDAQTVPQFNVQAPSGRAQPRRNDSDVLLCGRSDSATDEEGNALAMGQVPSRSLLEAALMLQWEDCADKGLFRYDVSQCETRVLLGDLGFIAQLNEGRATKKRPTEFSMDKVMQPFDPSKFNFRKAPVSEALVAFQPAVGGVFPATSVANEPFIVPPKAPLAALAREQASAGSGNPNLVFINVSPIDHGHVLLVPRVLDCLPQAVDPSTVLLAMQFARELGNPYFRVGYNSLGAFATINHLHFHSYYQPRLLPCEVAATEPLPLGLSSLKVPLQGLAEAGEPAPIVLPRKRKAGEMDAQEGFAGVRVSRLVDYPVNTFVVEAEPDSPASAGSSLKAIAAVVGAAAERMQADNQPFNLLMSECGRRVFIFPQCYAERQAARQVPVELLDTGVNPAAFEIAGHLVLKRAEDFEAASQGWAERLLAQVSLEEDRFLRVAKLCFGSWAADMASA